MSAAVKISLDDIISRSHETDEKLFALLGERLNDSDSLGFFDESTAYLDESAGNGDELSAETVGRRWLDANIEALSHDIDRVSRSEEDEEKLALNISNMLNKHFGLFESVIIGIILARKIIELKRPKRDLSTQGNFFDKQSELVEEDKDYSRLAPFGFDARGEIVAPFGLSKDGSVLTPFGLDDDGKPEAPFGLDENGLPHTPHGWHDDRERGARQRRPKRSARDLGGNPRSEQHAYTVRLNARVSRQLSERFSAEVESRGQTQTAALTEALEAWINRAPK